MHASLRTLVLLMAPSLLAICVISGCQTPQPEDTSSLTPIEPSTTQASSGQSLYKSNCATCHGVTGHGASSIVTERQVFFDSPDWHARYTDAQLTGIIKNGKGIMPAFGSSISDADLKTLVTYMRSLPKAQ